MAFEQLRRQYTLGGLHERDAANDPIEQFQRWIKTAIENIPADWVEPHAMTLSTSDGNGTISSRIVLLRGADQEGFVFYTNYESAKGQQLLKNPQASLLFYWGFLEQQVRIEGRVQKIDRERAEKYFHQRPRGSQLSAAVSPQSAVVPNRETLERQVDELAAKLGTSEVPLPDYWGGYVLVPERIEFWQGRENRLHDRLLYERTGSTWSMRRLAP